MSQVPNAGARRADVSVINKCFPGSQPIFDAFIKVLERVPNVTQRER